MTKQEAIKIWKDLDITLCTMDFSCGGDSMDDYNFTFETSKGKRIDSDDLFDYFDKVIWDNVTFYEASDGHYIGESGVVIISLEDSDTDVDEHYFIFSKDAQAEYNETATEKFEIELNEKQVEYINDNVSNINGGDDSSGAIINYKRDFIMTDEMTEIENELGKILDDMAEAHEFSFDEGEQGDWFRYTTNEEGDDIEINDNKLVVWVSRNFSIYRDSEW